jgi:hypothetical protein
MSDSDVAFRPVTVLDREIVFHNPTAIQVSMLHRLYKIMDVASTQLGRKDTTDAQRDRAGLEVVESMGKVLDLLGSLTDPMDEVWLASQMLTGKIGDEDLLKLLGDLLPDKEEPAKASAKKVRRA